MILAPIEALGTVWHVEFFETISDEKSLRDDVIAWLEEFESRYSRFRIDSWLSILNRTGEFLNPDPQFVDLLIKALDYYKLTNGIFNIAIGERLIKTGYDSSYSFTAELVLPEIPNLTGVLRVSKNKITLQHGALDFGGIGKGYAIDVLSDYLREKWQLQYFLINGGGDIYVTSDNGKPVTITLAHPGDRSLAIGTVNLENNGFAASSTRLRLWNDPKTGEEHNHLLTKSNVASYIIAPSAAEADVWATVSCLEQTLEPRSEVCQLLINGSGYVVRDTFTASMDKTLFTVYKK